MEKEWEENHNEKKNAKQKDVLTGVLAMIYVQSATLQRKDMAVCMARRYIKESVKHVEYLFHQKEMMRHFVLGSVIEMILKIKKNSMIIIKILKKGRKSLQ